MNTESPGPQQLGEIVANLVKAGYEPGGLGDFVCHYLGAGPISLSMTALGAALKTLVEVQAPHEVIGSFLFLHLKTKLPGNSQIRSEQQPPDPIQVIAPDQPDLIALIDARIEAAISKSLPKRVESKAFHVRILGKGTSVTLPVGMVDEFIRRFGKERLRVVINEIAAKPVVAPHNRSYNIQLAMKEIMAQPGTKQYPHGLQLLPGKAS